MTTESKTLSCVNEKRNAPASTLSDPPSAIASTATPPVAASSSSSAWFPHLLQAPAGYLRWVRLHAALRARTAPDAALFLALRLAAATLSVFHPRRAQLVLLKEILRDLLGPLDLRRRLALLALRPFP